MPVGFKLNEQEHTILAFAKRHFKQNKDAICLGDVDSASLQDIRLLIGGYRELYFREGRH